MHEKWLLKYLHIIPFERYRAQYIPKSMNMRVNSAYPAVGSLKLENAITVLEVEPNIIRADFFFFVYAAK